MNTASHEANIGYMNLKWVLGRIRNLNDTLILAQRVVYHDTSTLIFVPYESPHPSYLSIFYHFLVFSSFYVVPPPFVSFVKVHYSPLKFLFLCLPPYFVTFCEILSVD